MNRISCKIIVCLLLLVCSTQSFSQKIIVELGNLDFLKGLKKITIEYSYDNMSVGTFTKEEDYVKQKINEYNKQETGKGDKWLNAWKGDRSKISQPKFEKWLNEYTSPRLIANSEGLDAKYVMVVKTVFIEPGFNAGWPVKKNTSINLVYEFYDVNNKEQPIAKLICKNITGTINIAYDFDFSYRLSEAYAKAGKILGKYIVSIIK